MAVIMMFNLKTAPATFQRIITEIFEEYIPALMQVFLNNFAVYNIRGDHLSHLQLCLEKCRSTRLSLNPTKCAFGVMSDTLLDHILSSEGVVVDPGKIKAIIKAATPKNPKALSRFLGKMRWHNRMLRYLAEFGTPLHGAVHRTPFKWKEIEVEAINTLKIMLTQAPVIQPPDWTRPLHVFVDVSDIAMPCVDRPGRPRYEKLLTGAARSGSGGESKCNVHMIIRGSNTGSHSKET